jgi:hypothetical protein
MNEVEITDHLLGSSTSSTLLAAKSKKEDDENVSFLQQDDESDRIIRYLSMMITYINATMLLVLKWRPLLSRKTVQKSAAGLRQQN